MLQSRDRARQDKGNLTGAVADFSSTLKLEPGYAEAYAHRGLALLLQHKDKDAQQDFQRSLTLNKELKAELDERIRKVEALVAEKSRLFTSSIIVSARQKQTRFKWLRKMNSKRSRMFRPNKYNFLAALLCAILVVTTNAQQNNQQQPVGSPPNVPNLNSQGTRIAVIYTDFFYDPNNRGINRLVNAIKSLDQEFQTRKTELQSLQQRIEQLTNETSGTAQGMASTTAQTHLNELEQLKKDSQRKAEDAQAEYNKRLRDVLNPILEDLEKAIKIFAQQHGIALIFDGSKMDEALLYMGDGVDLTHVFIIEFNRANPSAPAPAPR